jgi:hypothetical protein
MKKIYDCFLFWQENDVVEIRINEHWDWVEKFIIVEADVTHAGNPKPFNFDEKRFEKYKEKIVYVKIHDFDFEMLKHPDIDCAIANAARGNQMQYRRDQFQCNYAITALRELNLQPDDIVLVCAADEILNRTAVETALTYFQDTDQTYNAIDLCGRQHFSHKLESGSTILENVRPIVWFEPDMFIYKMNILFKDPADLGHGDRHKIGVMTEYSNFCKMMPCTMRVLSAGTHAPIKKAGWHLSYMDDTIDGKKLLAKMHSWAHCFDLLYVGNPGKRRADLNTMEEAIDQIVQEFNLKIPESIIDITESTHPKYLVDNKEKFSNYILPV